ncbi:MAG: MotA/TolQ/ExbB proton channel family protein, partial [Bdellovibrionales bacterium]|nr:MotA/TolQ/ExbB proton channel family protein [Bdellovibrionales bacterium]
MTEEIDLAGQHSLLEMVTGSGPVVQAVLIILILLSIWSWAITLAKIMQLRKAATDSDEFSALFWESRNFSRVDDSTERLVSSPLVHLFRSGYRELGHITDPEGQREERASDLESDLDSVKRALKRAELDQVRRLERGITFLATVASAAPFIGLFGTVWGIMNAFHGLSSVKSTTLQAVAPGISEALVATAIGLAAAIPAAMAYNYFAVAVRHFRES